MNHNVLRKSQDYRSTHVLNRASGLWDQDAKFLAPELTVNTPRTTCWTPAPELQTSVPLIKISSSKLKITLFSIVQTNEKVSST